MSAFLRQSLVRNSMRCRITLTQTPSVTLAASHGHGFGSRENATVPEGSDAASPITGPSPSTAGRAPEESVSWSGSPSSFLVWSKTEGLGRRHSIQDEVSVYFGRPCDQRRWQSSDAGERFKVYTKTGDKGESSLYDGQRRRKDDPTFDALGDVDELNSALGLAHEYCLQVQELAEIRRQIEEIQSRLLDAGSAVATPLDSLSSKKLARVKFNPATVEVLEKWIDKMDEELPQLTSFILPSGGLPAASLHLARSICRRAERKVVTLTDVQLVDRSVAQYLNRLSDYLFTAARYAAFKLKKPENVWMINKR